RPQRLAHCRFLAPLRRPRHRPAGVRRPADRPAGPDRRPSGRGRPRLLLSQGRRTLTPPGPGLRPLLPRTRPTRLPAILPVSLLSGAGAVADGRRAPRSRLAWIRPAYVALLTHAGNLLAPDVMPIRPPATAARVYGSLTQPLADRLGWDSLTRAVEDVYAGLPP